MLIDVIMLIHGLSPEALKNRETILQSYASNGTDLRLVTTMYGPPSVDSLPEMEIAAPGILERAIRSEEEGADAIIIWGGHDPSLDAARNLVKIPVMAPGMASMYLASMLVDKFALIIQLPHVKQVAEKQLRDLGLTSRCSGIYPVNLPVLALREPGGFKKILETTLKAVDEGANAICFGCMALNDHSEKIQNEIDKHYKGVLVIKPGKTTIKLTEQIVGLGYTHSKRSYPFPPKKVNIPKWKK
jgi:allantoin racemase